MIFDWFLNDLWVSRMKPLEPCKVCRLLWRTSSYKGVRDAGAIWQQWTISWRMHDNALAKSKDPVHSPSQFTVSFSSPEWVEYKMKFTYIVITCVHSFSLFFEVIFFFFFAIFRGQDVVRPTSCTRREQVTTLSRSCEAPSPGQFRAYLAQATGVKSARFI